MDSQLFRYWGIGGFWQEDSLTIYNSLADHLGYRSLNSDSSWRRADFNDGRTSAPYVSPTSSWSRMFTAARFNRVRVMIADCVNAGGNREVLVGSRGNFVRRNPW